MAERKRHRGGSGSGSGSDLCPVLREMSRHRGGGGRRGAVRGPGPHASAFPFVRPFAPWIFLNTQAHTTNDKSSPLAGTHDHTNNTTPPSCGSAPADTSSRGTAPQNKNTTPCSVGHVPTHVRRVLSPARCRRARRPPYSLVRRSPDLRPISARTDACPHPDLVTARTSKVSSDIPHSSGISP